MWTLAEDLNARGMEKEAVTVYAALAEKFPPIRTGARPSLKSASLRMSLVTAKARNAITILHRRLSGKPSVACGDTLLDVAGTDAGIV